MDDLSTRARRQRAALQQLMEQGILSQDEFQRVREVLSAPEAPPPWSWPDGIDGERDPLFLLLPLREYLRERHARVKLHWMLDTAEISVRWCVTLALAEVLAANRDGLPLDLQAELWPEIQRPTLGRWLKMLRLLTRFRPPSPATVPAVFDLSEGILDEVFCNRIEASEASSLLVLRNRLAHGGGLSTEGAGHLVRHHEARFFELLRRVAACTRGCSLVATGPVGPVCLDGLRPRQYENMPPGEPEDGIWLISGVTWLPLFPLAVYGPVQTEPVARASASPPAPQIYARTEGRFLTYTPLGRDEARALRPGLEALQKLLGPLRSEAPLGRQWQRFLETAREREEQRVGRAEEVQFLREWIHRREVGELAGPHVAWVGGPPGAGKSVVMGALAVQLWDESARGLYYHRFGAGEGPDDTRQMLVGLRAALTAGAVAPVSAPAVDLDSLVYELEALIQHLDAPFRVLVDGVDEGCRHDPWLPETLRKLVRLPNTIWVLAGRFGEERLSAEQAFGPTGLPPMKPDEVRNMLLEGLCHWPPHEGQSGVSH